MSWNPLDNSVDQAKIGGQLTPGICEIIGADSPRAWDERQGYGLTGATVFYHGTKLSHFSIKFWLYTAQDWDDWHAFRPLVDRPPIGKRARSLDIAHPLLEDLGIRSIVIESVGVAEQADDGVWTIELKVIEFRQPKFTMAKPEGSTATPVDPVEQEIQTNSDRIAQLLAAP